MNKTTVSSWLRVGFATIFWFYASLVQGVNRKMDSNYFTGVEAKLEAAVRSDDRAAIAAAVAAGANVNARGIHNITPLMIAVDRLKRNAVTELLAKGANPNLKADDGASPVSLAVENYRDAPDIMLAVFKSGGNPNIRRPNDDPVIKRFLNDRNCEFIRHMKALGADLDITTRGGDPIITAASTAGDWDVVWCLIELGAKYDYEKTSRAPLTRSLAGTFPSFDSPIFPYKQKVWQFFKDHGIPVQPLRE